MNIKCENITIHLLIEVSCFQYIQALDQMIAFALTILDVPRVGVVGG